MREYFMDRVVHFESDAATLGVTALGLLSGGVELVDSRCAIIACSSANISRNVFAMNVATEGVGIDSDGTWLGV